MASPAPQSERRRLGNDRQRLYEDAAYYNVATLGRSEAEVRDAVRDAWLEENRTAVEGWNAWVEKNGLPLERYRPL
ncbi:MAG TPA: type II toxin-antitoxin system CcdA family antitoxin [Allosphingosinicella sp.]|jgi:antitoxin CcdA